MGLRDIFKKLLSFKKGQDIAPTPTRHRPHVSGLSRHLFTRKLTPARFRKMESMLRGRDTSARGAAGFKPPRPIFPVEAGANRQRSIAFRRSPRFPEVKVRGAE